MAKVMGWLLRVAGWMLALLVVAVIVVAVLRRQAFGDEERAALALMAVAPVEVAGSNGFAALVLAGHDVPAGRREEVLAADVAAFVRYEEELADSVAFWDTVDPAEMPAVEPFVAFAGVPQREPMPVSDDLCGMSAADCLAQVRSHPEATRELLDQHAARLASAEEAIAADGFASPYPPSIYAPLPAFSSLRLPLSAAALDAVEGRAPQAYARTCALLDGARRLDRQGRNLIEKLIAQAVAKGAAALLLELRREHPVAALPASCAEARVAVGLEEAWVCEAMRGEFRFNESVGAQLDAQLRGWRPDKVLTRALLVDRRLQAATMAKTLAPYCSEASADLAAAGLPPEPVATPALPAGCYSAYITCMLVQIAAPSFEPYAARALDHAAILRLLLAAQDVADGTLSAGDAAAAASVAGYPVDFDPLTERAGITLRQPLDPDRTTYEVDFAGLAPAPRTPPRARLPPASPSLHAGLAAAAAPALD